MQIIKFILIKIIKFYKLFISPYLGNNCRYMPTCSEYFVESLEEHGVLKGYLKGTKSILSCPPIRFLGGGAGFDPVNKRIK